MKTLHKYLSIILLAALLSLTFATPVLAYEGREGDKVVIAADEVISNDLYVTANEFTLNGTINGDLVVFAKTIVINGTVQGDVIGAGQSIVINGTVSDSVRVAGAALQLGETAVLKGDLIGAAASLETKPGSQIMGDLVYGGAQALLAGSIKGDALIGAGGLDLEGEIVGDFTADVGDVQGSGPSPSMYITDAGISIPNISPGMIIGKGAKIQGNFTYTQSKDIEIPAGVVGGEITRNEPTVSGQQISEPPTPAQVAATWTFKLLRYILTLIVLGLLAVWLFPNFTKSLIDNVQSQPVASFGWGVVSYAVFFFSILLILMGIIMGAFLFGGTLVWAGLLTIFALLVGFALFTLFLTKIIAAWLGGKWLMGRIYPAMENHKFWPLILGLVIVGILVKLPVIGWLISFLLVFLGLGALWIWGRERLKQARVPVVTAS